MSDVIAALAEQGIRIRDATPGNHKVVCPACSHTRRKKTDPCLSVTIEQDGRALWNCHHCNWSGGAGGEGYRPRRERRAYRRPVPVAAPQRPDTLLAWFGKRAISAETVERFGIYKTRTWFPQTETELDAVAFPYMWQGVLRNVKYRSAEKYFRQEKEPEPVFFNADAIAAGEDLIITEGEPDVMAFAEAGFEHVVSLPNGAPQKENEPSDKRYEPLDTHWDDLQGVKRFLIATDMDEPGVLLAAELAKRLGKDRCWRVRMPTSNDVMVKDVNQCLIDHGAAVLRECVDGARPWPIDGLHETDDFREDVANLYHGLGPQPTSTGFAELDKAFKFLPTQFIVITGVPNHGKSRVLDQIAVQLARRGEKWAMFSPETGEANHIADLCEIWAGMPFFEGPTYRLPPEELDLAQDWVRDHFYFIVAKDHTPAVDWVLERARAAVTRYGVKHLLIDPYNELEASRPDRQTETEFVSQLISKAKRFAKHHEVTVWMIVHPTKLRATDDGSDPVPGLYDLSGSAHWRNKADAGLVVYRDYASKMTLIVSKKIRRQPICGRPGSVKFVFDGTSRRFEALEGSFTQLGGS